MGCEDPPYAFVSATFFEASLVELLVAWAARLSIGRFVPISITPLKIQLSLPKRFELSYSPAVCSADSVGMEI